MIIPLHVIPRGLVSGLTTEFKFRTPISIVVPCVHVHVHVHVNIITYH